MSNGANYREIQELIRKRIEAGELAFDEKLPREADLAKEFCVSRSTVHRALSALEQDGYVRSRKRAGTFVAWGRRERKQLVALIFDRVARNFDFPSSEMIEGIRETLGDAVGLVLCDSKDSVEREANFLARMSKETDGVICFPIADQRDGQLLERIHGLGCPVVVVDRIPTGYAGSSVISDDREAMFEAVRMLRRQGHTEIGFIGFFKETVSSAMERYRAFVDAIKSELGVDGEQNVRWIGRDFEHNGILLAQAVSDTLFALCRRENPVTALVCMQDDLGLKAMLAVEDLGLKVHSGFEIVTINEWPALELRRPWDIHRIVRKKRAIGIAAAELLLEQIVNPKCDARAVAIKADFIPSSPSGSPALDAVQAWLNNDKE
ncbi:MAG: GntR family transcriptional regulator [Armatimonadota bacterium]